MKKIIALIALAFATFTVANAQVGIVGGYTSSSVNASQAVQDAQKASVWHAGIAFKAEIGPLFALQPSLTYSVKGTTVENLQYKSGYAEASLGLQLGFDFAVVRPFGVFEPFVGYQVTGNEQTANDVTNKLEYGFAVGAGCDILEHLQVRVQWFKNLGALQKANTTAVQGAIQEGNYQGIIITLGLFF